MRVSTLVICAVALLGVAKNSTGDRATEASVKSPASSIQDVSYLDRRVSSLEQRLSLIESNLSRLQQDVQFSQRAVPTQRRDPEVQILRGELETLKVHIRELDCGLVRLDERTLSSAAKASRKSAAIGVDPCRLNADAPIQLTTRP